MAASVPAKTVKSVLVRRLGSSRIRLQPEVALAKGWGPLEGLMSREYVTGIMVCGPKKIFIEVKGKLILTDIQFRNERHLRNVASCIVQSVGRRLDDKNPICDVRLKDGSRMAIVIPPIAISGTNITISRLSKNHGRTGRNMK